MTVKETNFKRKTPCAEVKRGLKNPATVSIYCRCCGEWALNVYNKPIRVYYN